MHYIRRAEDRGKANHGWLESNHTFSFANYFDPEHMGYRALRVINEDRVAPGRGFGTHGHRDMEIISYVLDGALEHKDSMGTGSIIAPGEVQLMSAGSGVLHSEYNPSDADKVHFLQIWIMPEARGTTPGYQQKPFPTEERRGRWRLLVSPDGSDESLIIKQDARLYGSLIEPDEELTHNVDAGRGVWIHVARGAVEVEGENLKTGDAIALEDVDAVTVKGVERAELLLFDLGSPS